MRQIVLSRHSTRSDSLPLSAFLTKIRGLASVSEEDIAALSTMRLETRFHAAGSELTFIGDHPQRSYLISDGFACMYKLTGPGRRQIVGFSVAGDMPDLQSLHSRRTDASTAAITDVNVVYVPHEDVKTLSRARPNLNRVFWRLSLVEASTAREWLVNVGQRGGKLRLAHLLCEMFTRLDAVGLVKDQACFFPITQVDLADATGMTSVHVNRMMQELRKENLLTLDRRTLRILDLPRLIRFADFDAEYLQLARSSEAQQ